MIHPMRTFCTFSIIAASSLIFFITDRCHCFSSQSQQHHRWRWHQRRSSSSLLSAASLLKPSTPSASNDALCAIHKHDSSPSSTTTKYSTITQQLLSLEEHEQIDRLVHERSISRWNGDYHTADKIRSSIEELRIIIPLSRILQITKEQNYLLNADDIKSQQEGDMNIELEYKVMVTDIPRTEGGGSYWELIPMHNEQLIDIIIDHTPAKKENILQLAHAALGLAVSASDRGVDVDKAMLDNIIRRAIDRLQALKQAKELNAFLPGVTAASTAGELHGRKAADAVLWFALAGYHQHCSHNPEDNRSNRMGMQLYNDLVDIATEELQRFGKNSSCRAKDVLHIVERIGMAGIVGASSQRLFRVAAECLEVKMMHGYAAITDSDNHEQTNINDNTDDDSLLNANEKDESIDYESIIQSLRDYSFGLHSDRSLLGLWRFSTRQRKQRVFFKNAARHFHGTYQENEHSFDDYPVNNFEQYNWSTMFTDPSRPLVVDVGCGMGVSILGLASNQHINEHDSMNIDWSKCNFVGVDLSRLAIGYAKGVCSRWGLENVLNFIVDSAEKCLIEINESYPGKVELIMLQFPTPYRFPGIADNDAEGMDNDVAPSLGFNTQLPEGSESNDFMVTEKLLAQIHDILSKHDGRLLIQCNCEDVAVYMRNASTKVGFESNNFKDHVTTLACVTQRSRRWTEMGGERAIGEFWSPKPLLPSNGRTETEVACMLDGKPVHRCLLIATTTSQLSR